MSGDQAVRRHLGDPGVEKAEEEAAADRALAELEVEIEQLRSFVRAAQDEQEKLEARLQPLRARLNASRGR